jgi:hypothetical protein
VSTDTAIVVSVALALTVGLPTDVAVTVPVFVAALAAVLGTSTLAQTVTVPPAEMLAVVVRGVVQVESKKCVAHELVADIV